MAQGHNPVALCPCSQHDPPNDWIGWIGGDNPTATQKWQTMQDWYNVHDQALFHAPVAPDQVAPWQFVKGPITDDEAMVLAQRAACLGLRPQFEAPATASKSCKNYSFIRL